MTISIGIAGSGSAVEAIMAALGDVDIPVERTALDDLPAYQLGVVIDRAGEDTFAHANDILAGPWVAVELGGIGGHAVTSVSASIAGFTPESGCYACLETRIAAGDPDTEPPEINARTARLTGAIAGHELLAAIAGEETPLFGGVIELPYTQRRVLPVPGCCGGPPPAPERTAHEDRSLEEAIMHAEVAVDERVGIVRDIGEVASFPAPYYLATNTDTSGFSDASAAS